MIVLADHNDFSSMIARDFTAQATFSIVGEVVVTFPEDEMIQVGVDELIFSMIWGSDDDHFYFFAPTLRYFL